MATRRLMMSLVLFVGLLQGCATSALHGALGSPSLLGEPQSVRAIVSCALDDRGAPELVAELDDERRVTLTTRGFAEPPARLAPAVRAVPLFIGVAATFTQEDELRILTDEGEALWTVEDLRPFGLPSHIVTYEELGDGRAEVTLCQLVDGREGVELIPRVRATVPIEARGRSEVAWILPALPLYALSVGFDVATFPILLPLAAAVLATGPPLQLRT